MQSQAGHAYRGNLGACKSAEKIPLSEFYDNFCANREKAVLAALGEAEIGIGDPEYPKTAQTSLSLALSAQAYSIVSAAVAQTLIPEEEPKQKKN